jgi:plastocyanin
MLATDPRTRIARRLLPAALLVALLTVSVAQAAEGTDPETLTPAASPAQQPPTPVPAQDGAAAAAPATTVAEQAPTATPAPPGEAPVAVAVSRAKASATRSVSIVDFAFAPASITVDVGDTVRWTNQDSAPHDVTGDGLDSGRMQEGDTYIHTFTSAGSVSYICTIHPSMKGTVRVLDRSGGAGEDEDAGAAQEDTATPVPTPPAGSEAAAVASPGAGGTDSSLPATGEDLLGAMAAGLGLLFLGLALRLRPAGAAAARDWLP